MLIVVGREKAKAKEKGESKRAKIRKANREVQRAGMEISLTKTEVMTVNGDDPSDIILNGVKIKEVRSFNYLGSALNDQGEISEAVSNNCRKARTAIVKMRPALTSGSLRLRTKVKLVETFIKPTLLYGLETAVIRKVDFGKLNAVLNKARRMILKLDSKRTCTNVEIAEKVPLKSIEVELAVRRANLWASIVKLKVDAVRSQAVKSKVYAKDWLRALDLDLDRLGIIRKDEWIKDPKPLKYNNEVDQSTQRMVGSRPQIVPCEAGNCSLKFAERKEMLRHLRRDHEALEEQDNLQMTPFFSIIPKDNFNCPAARCKKQFKTLGWLKSHVAVAHPQCTLITSTDVVGNDDSEDLLEGQTHRIDQDHDERDQDERDQGVRNQDERDQEAVAEDQILPASAPGIYQCPKCPRKYTVLKSVQNHCLQKHAWSYSRQQPVRGRETGSSQARNTSTRDRP